MTTEEQILEWNRSAIRGQIPDDENPIFIFHQTSTDLLVDMLSGKINVKALIKHQLKCRGFDQTGRFVGFNK